MNKQNINSKSTTGQDISDATITGAKGIADQLSTLDAQMSASGFGADQPWRVQLAAAITAEDGQLDAIDDITLATETLDALLTLALQVCSERGNIDKAASAIRAARRYVVDINETAAFMTGAAA